MLPVEKAILETIRRQYGALISKSAAAHCCRPEVIGGIMMRESRGGQALKPPGPAGTGDGGHGRGLMQIDDRSFKSFCAGDRWKDHAENIDFGCQVLQRKGLWLAIKTRDAGLRLMPGQLESAAIAAYNCGEGNILKAVTRGIDVDRFTAHGNYSICVLEYAEAYKNLGQSASLPGRQANAREAVPIQVPA